MAFVLEDRVVETANNPGQGDFELLGAVENSWTFVTGIGNGNTTRYLAVGAEGAEIGVAQVQAGSPDRLLRPGTVKNFDGTTTPVNFSGTVTVACIASVEDVLWLGENGDLPARGGRDLGTAGDPWRDGHFSGEVQIDGETAYHRGNIVGTASQSGGSPTGAVIEWGDNAEGRYTKFADGTLICSSHTFESRSSAGALVTTKVWPHPFESSYYVVSLTIRASTDAVTGWYIDDRTPSSIDIRIYRSNDFGTGMFLIAIGRWY